jgi:hypothetical protein
LGLAGCGPKLPSGKVDSYLNEERKHVPAAVVALSVMPCVSSADKLMGGLMKIPLSKMLEQWKKEHFVPNASEGKLLFCVEEAQIKEVPLKASSHFFGFLSSEESKEKYVARITVIIQYEHPRFPKMSPGRISVQTERYVPQASTVEDRRLLISFLCEDVLMRLTQETDLFLAKLIGGLCPIGKRPL